MTTLHIEVIASIVAAAILGLIAGWMIKSARAKRQLKATTAKWQKKTGKLEKAHADEIEGLETKLQEVGENIRELTTKNRQLTADAQNSGVTVDKARSDAIELNRKQAELQDRLQRIIRQKEREIAALQGNLQDQTSDEISSITREPTREESDVEAYIDSQASRGKRAHIDAHSARSAAAVIAHANDDTNVEDDQFDSTTVLDGELILADGSGSAAETLAINVDDQGYEDTLAAVTSELDMTHDATYNGPDEATIVLDDDALARVRAKAQKP